MNSGCHTRPAFVVSARSGLSSGLPTFSARSGWLLQRAALPVLARQKSLFALLLKLVGGLNSSDRFGARMSRDCRARRRIPGIGVSQVTPTFQVLVSPAVE